MIVEEVGDENGVFETNTARYKMYESYGPISIVDETLVNDEFKRYKVEIDKKKARSKAMELADKGMQLDGFSMFKVKRIKRS